jgi:large subunit ribosomal protein L21e
MMAGKKARGWRAKTRAKVTAHRIKPTITQRLRTFKEGETVQVIINGAFHSGMPFRRFHGLTGKVTGMQGRAAIVKLQLGNQWCELVVSPVHLKDIKQNTITQE